jgi:hypothetical protein
MTGGAPYPIPLQQLAPRTPTVGGFENSVNPIARVTVPMAQAGWLYHAVEEWERTIEFTPIASIGNLTSIDYSLQPDWEGDKFVRRDTITADPPLPTLGVNNNTMPDDSLRAFVRGYQLGDELGDSIAGEWMGVGLGSGPVYSFFAHSWDPRMSVTDKAMRYDAPEDYEAAKAELSTVITDMFSAWSARLAAQAATATGDRLAEIQRQQAALVILQSQAQLRKTAQIDRMEEAKADLETADQVWADRFATNGILAEIDAFARWIRAEEELEAFALRYGSLQQFRNKISDWCRWRASAGMFGAEEAAVYSIDKIYGLGFVGGKLATVSGDAPTLIPAFGNADLALHLSGPLPSFIDEFGDPDFVSGYWSQLEHTVGGWMIDDGQTSIEGTGTLSVAVHPVAIGFNPEDCIAELKFGCAPYYSPRMHVLEGQILSGRLYDPEIGLVGHSIEFGEIFANDGSTVTYQIPGDLPLGPDNTRAWAFQSPYATYTTLPANPEDPTAPTESVDVSGLQTLWQTAATALADQWEAISPAGTPCGLFQILGAENEQLYAHPLHATPQSVGTVDITYKAVTLRDTLA